MTLYKDVCGLRNTLNNTLRHYENSKDRAMKLDDWKLAAYWQGKIEATTDIQALLQAAISTEIRRNGGII